MTNPSVLDTGRRYLVPVARLDLPDEPNTVHLSVYTWHDRLEAWVTGRALCGYSTTQGALADGTAVTCPGCVEALPDYERMLAPADPAFDDPRALSARVRAADELLRRYVALAEVTHKYPIVGGHDCIGENLTCAGCGLLEDAREYLDDAQ